jgi:hypothetical protein
MTEYREPNQASGEERNKRIKLSPASIAEQVTAAPYQPYQDNHAWDYGLEVDSAANGLLIIIRGVDQTCLHKAGKRTKGEAYLIDRSLVLGDMHIYCWVHHVLVSCIQLGLKDIVSPEEIEQTVAKLYTDLCDKMTERDASITKPGRSFFINSCYNVIANAKSGGWKVVDDSHVITRLLRSRLGYTVMIDPKTE